MNFDPLFSSVGPWAVSLPWNCRVYTDQVTWWPLTGEMQHHADCACDDNDKNMVLSYLHMTAYYHYYKSGREQYNAWNVNQMLHTEATRLGIELAHNIWDVYSDCIPHPKDFDWDKIPPGTPFRVDIVQDDETVVCEGITHYPLSVADMLDNDYEAVNEDALVRSPAFPAPDAISTSTWVQDTPLSLDEAEADNPHIIRRDLTNDNQVLADYLSTVHQSIGVMRLIRPPPGTHSGPVIFKKVQKRPLGVSLNSILAAFKLS
ncbi:hypothetical protein F4779DRAFT_624505 [Xylariaceae sp. FL0662B]|nr:hypothetical protein F4779DRAFT_624505 [Xylariaceae sp. FL0662B]